MAETEPTAELQEELVETLRQAAAASGPVLVLTGAGISAESGIPTFRGEEGYWQVGSRNYRPEELATHAAFRAMPEDVWAWYLYRRSVCHSAQPNPGHLALVKLEKRLGPRFLLITQNVDGLHLRAGNSLARTYQIHGNLDFWRCDAECRTALLPMPDGLVPWARGQTLTAEAKAKLRCPACAAWGRPHVLWFDECYDEERYRWDSSLRAAAECSLLLVVGTSGATRLPTYVCSLVAQRQVAQVVVNATPSPFSRMAQENPLGHFVQAEAGAVLPAIADLLGAAP